EDRYKAQWPRSKEAFLRPVVRLWTGGLALGWRCARHRRCDIAIGKGQLQLIAGLQRGLTGDQGTIVVMHQRITARENIAIAEAREEFPQLLKPMAAVWN